MTPSEEYHALADAMPQIVWTARSDGYVDYYNRRWFEYTGSTLEETNGWGWQPVLHPDDLQRCVSCEHAASRGNAHDDANEEAGPFDPALATMDTLVLPLHEGSSFTRLPSRQ